MKKLVIFDLDGTLLDTLGDLCQAVNFAMEIVDRPNRSIADIRTFIGNGTKKLIELSLDNDCDEALVERCIAAFSSYYGEHYNENTVKYEGVAECIDMLIENGIAVGVVTNKLDKMAKMLCLEHFGDKFVGVMGDVPEFARKPDPSKIFKMMRDAGCDECILVGDSRVDIKTAKNAGIECIAVSWGFESRENILANEPEYIADNCAELIECLKKALKI